jgi:hypothetical protein
MDTVFHIISALGGVMRKVIVIAALGLMTLALPALAVVPENVDSGNDGAPGQGGSIRSIECPGTVVWDTGMFDEYTVPAGCSSAGSAGCFVNAINDGGFPADGRRLADDFFGLGGDPITAIKIWNRFNQQGYDYHLTNPASVHGFCVKFYGTNGSEFYCPDGTVAGEEAIGPIIYDQYCPVFVEEEITTGVPRHYAYCVTLPQPFYADYGVPYWMSISADFDFTSYADGVTQFFNRAYPGVGNSVCEGSWWDTWNGTEVPWNAMSVALNIPCWAGWDLAFKLYSSPFAPPTGACCVGDQGECHVVTAGECETLGGQYQGDTTVCDPNPCPIVPIQDSSWGSIKANFR